MSAKDPETMTFEELRALADQEMNGEKVEAPVVQAETEEEPAKTTENQDPETETDPEEVDEVVYRREIDLGDGSGVQVFEGKSIEELVDKLAEAQKHATRKIRELSAKKEPAKSEEQVTEEEWLLAQELATKPSLAFDKIFQKKFGKTPAQMQETLKKVEQFEQTESERTAAEEFITNTPDYHPSKRNGAKIERYLQTYNLPGTVENIEQAFKDLSESGLLETKPATQSEETETQDAETQNGTRIVSVKGHQRRAASGLSTKRTATVTRTTRPTLEEAESLSFDQLEKLANQELSGQLQ